MIRLSIVFFAFVASQFCLADVISPKSSEQLKFRSEILSEASYILASLEKKNDPIVSEIKDYDVIDMKFTLDPLGVALLFVSPFEGDKDRCVIVDNDSKKVIVKDLCPEYFN